MFSAEKVLAVCSTFGCLAGFQLDGVASGKVELLLASRVEAYLGPPVEMLE